MVANLDGKVALITGAARRIGATIARTLHDNGACIAIHFRGSDSDAAALAESLNRNRPDSAAIFQADITRLQELETLAGSVIDWHGRLDLLVNNASSFYPTPLGSLDESHWHDLIGTNLKAPVFLSQAVLPALQATRGSIVNIVDIHARRPLRDHVLYGAAKAGLAMLTRSLAKDLAPDVRVNGVAPGAILWPESGLSKATRQSILGKVPLGRPGDPHDIGNCVLWLWRDADYVTGQIIAVDGGRSIGW